jgi:hypothetical protein
MWELQRGHEEEGGEGGGGVGVMEGASFIKYL